MEGETFRRGKIKHLNGTTYRVPEDILPTVATAWTLGGLAEWLPEEPTLAERVKEMAGQVQTAAVDAVKETAARASAPFRKQARSNS